jgi:hypothetical protein
MVQYAAGQPTSLFMRLLICLTNCRLPFFFSSPAAAAAAAHAAPFDGPTAAFTPA